MEYQWVSDLGDKGIRSYFAEDLTIEGLQLMPINEDWFVFWEEINELVNYHYPLVNQRYAYDMLIMSEGSSFDGDSEDNESFLHSEKKCLHLLMA